MFGPRRHHRGHHQGRRQNYALILLLMQLAQVGFDKIPPVTLVTILGQVAIYLRLFQTPPIKQICISAVNVWYKEEWQRLVFAAFFHLDDWHLYYNMVSFLWKGITLERRYGSAYMAVLLSVFVVLCNVTTVGLAMFAENVLDDPSYLSQCAAGFSGVIFALKVVTTYLMPPGMSYVMGFFPVHSRLACWVELLAIQFMVPNASFMGHLAGILVGMAYVKGPLKYIVDETVSIGKSMFRPNIGGSSGGRFTGSGSSGQRSYGSGSGGQRLSGSGSGGQRLSGSGSGHQPQNGANNEDEQLQEAIRRSLNERYDRRPAPSAPSPQAEEAAADAPPPTLPPSYHSNSNSPGGTGRMYPDLDNSYSTGPYPTEPPPPYPGNTNNVPLSGSAATAAAPPSYGWNVNSDEVRRRRLQRFDS